MAEIVNLRQVRKRAARAERERKAEENRTLHAMPAKLRKAVSKENELRRGRHEAHRLTDDPPGEGSR